MPYLSRDLRRDLENTIKAARVAAEAGAADALRRLGVAAAELPARLEGHRADRNRLRARARSLGDRLLKGGAHEIHRLTEAAAYVQWHRLLFARFLLERGLLRDETGVPISLTDCREEATIAGSGDEWSIASGHAARLLPGVFPPDDPVESLSLAPEHTKALRDLLRGLDAAIFDADDSLGWTYQFWRAAEKQAVNDSQVKIGASELPAVTQLFTEPYMVRFLLHNTLGAWWAGKVLASRPELARDGADEDALRAACAMPGYSWDYLRFVRENHAWRPAAGAFPGWPSRAAEITLLDPCCGSGHFLTEALAAIAALRVAEEDLSEADAVVAALRDNLHGLEIDGRCVQIATFSLALTAWRIGGSGTRLPTPHVAWVGAPPPLPKSEFAALANSDADLRRGLEALYDLFVQAPLLGSLIEVTGGDLASPTRIARIEQSIAALVERIRKAEPERAEGALAALGMADALHLLSAQFTAVLTNFPFLTEIKFHQDLVRALEARTTLGEANLATLFLYRSAGWLGLGGTLGFVAPQAWWFLKRYTEVRGWVCKTLTVQLLARLGERAFESSQAGGELVGLNIVSALESSCTHSIETIDVSSIIESKSIGLINTNFSVVRLQDIISRDDMVIVFSTQSTKGEKLKTYATALRGVGTGDSTRFVRSFWEVQDSGYNWEFHQTTSAYTKGFSGTSEIIFWQNEEGDLASLAEAVRHLNHAAQNWRRGKPNWGRRGAIVSQMAPFSASIYTGEIYDSNCCAIVPNDDGLVEALWAYCSSDEFRRRVQDINQNRKVEVGTFLEIPFDVDRWTHNAAERFPEGLPEPFTDDPTQWLFHGHPRYAESGSELHVALARLAGYRWPAETDAEVRLSAEARSRVAEAAALPEADAGGLLALVAVLGERPLADRLRAYCATAWGDAWTPGLEAKLVADACERAKDKSPKQLTLDTWLRSHAARQHSKLFHDRPFLWWITDGRADGFTAVAHYHRLTRANLERLVYTVVGDWLIRLGDDPRSEAARVLQAKLGQILDGEKPYDIFVRWKPLEEQPLGWDPDLDDGVRLNIRPFIEAKVLAFEPNVKYAVDRGKDIASAPWFELFEGERRNDYHTTLADKRTARAAIAKAAK